MRRDNCLLVRNVVTTCLEKILIERDVQAAVSYVKVGTGQAMALMMQDTVRTVVPTCMYGMWCVQPYSTCSSSSPAAPSHSHASCSNKPSMLDPHCAGGNL